MKTAELTGATLDYWVAKAEGLDIELGQDGNFHGAICDDSGEDWYHFSPSTQWGQGGPIIDREKIELVMVRGEWCGYIKGCAIERDDPEGSGPTHLIAAMRAYVTSKFGEEVPD